MHLVIIHFLHIWNQETLAVANVLLALFTLILAVGVPLSIAYSARQERDTFYATLDRAYFDIQKTIVEYPHLANPDPTSKTPDQITQYDAFAFLTWNFVESIFDYAEDNAVLRETWDCILRYEAALHGAWFLEPRNRPKFKKKFKDFIEEKDCIPLHLRPPQSD